MAAAGTHNDKLDLGLQVIICEVVIELVIVRSGSGHVCNLLAAAITACEIIDVGPGAPHGTWPLGAA